MKHIGKSVGTLGALFFFTDVLALATHPWEISTKGSDGRSSAEIIRAPGNSARGRIIEERPRVPTQPLISTRRPPVIIVDSIRPSQEPAAKPSK